MLLFDLETAKKITNHYSYLVGKQISPDNLIGNIDYIVFCPANTEDYKDFIQKFANCKDNEMALIGYRMDVFNVKLLHYLIKKNLFLSIDLDKYLDSNYIKQRDDFFYQMKHNS